MVHRGKIRLLIVDDSLFFRSVLSKGLSRDARLDVVGMAVDADDAKEKIKQLKPDVLTLDVEMPKMNGIDFLKQLMRTNPLPVVMVSSLDARVFDILEAGAVDFVQKPKSKAPEDMDAFFRELISKIKIGVVAKLAVRSRSLPQAESRRTASLTDPATERKERTAERVLSAPALLGGLKGGLLLQRTVIAIGASTGGTDALLEVLKRLPENMPGIVVTQHMPAGFTSMFAERLDRLCAMSVKEAENQDMVKQGQVLIAPGGKQMSIMKTAGGYMVRCAPGEKVSGHCPSVDFLFTSVAQYVGADAVGVIMTGMGSDGAQGLLKMRQAGAYTLGQDKESCVVYGMPMVAFKNGAVVKETSCENISSEIVQYLKRRGG